MATLCQHRHLTWMMLTAALLGGCAAPESPASSASAPTPLAVSPPPAQPVPRISSVLGTHFLIAIKIPACFTSAVASAPIAALYTLANQGEIPPEPDFYQDADLANAVYCGPPWTIPP